MKHKGGWYLDSYKQTVEFVNGQYKTVERLINSLWFSSHKAAQAYMRNLSKQGYEISKYEAKYRYSNLGEELYIKLWRNTDEKTDKQRG